MNNVEKWSLSEPEGNIGNGIQILSLSVLFYDDFNAALEIWPRKEERQLDKNKRKQESAVSEHAKIVKCSPQIQAAFCAIVDA